MYTFSWDYMSNIQLKDQEPCFPGPAPPASVLRLQSQNEVPSIKDLDEYLRNKYDREQRRKFSILKTERVDIARGGGLFNHCRSSPTHPDDVAQSSSEDSMDLQDVKLGRCSSTMSKRIRLIKRSNSDDTRASTDKTPVSSTDILTEQKRPQKRAIRLRVAAEEDKLPLGLTSGRARLACHQR